VPGYGGARPKRRQRAKRAVARQDCEGSGGEDARGRAELSVRGQQAAAEGAEADDPRTGAHRSECSNGVLLHHHVGTSFLDFRRDL
jgi:hypothetical protein